ncbi:hypothetical protein D9M72_545050 [compost metagenome]
MVFQSLGACAPLLTSGNQMLKEILLLSAALSLAGQAVADPVPDGIRSAIKNLPMQSWTFNAGKLRLVLDRPIISPTFYSTAVHLVCGEQWREPKTFKRMQLERIEVLNSANAQGLALLNADEQCRRLGSARGDAGERLVQTEAVRCEAGVCRKRD